MPVKKLYRIRERDKVLFDFSLPNSEFGRVHPAIRFFEVEEMRTQQVIKTFKLERSAVKWIKRNNGILKEHC